MTGTLTTICLLLGGAAAAESIVDFDTQVMPIFSVAGCNAAACHGAATGQAGFRLSLFGGDPDADYQALVHAREGRRVNLHRAVDSLLLLKATGQIEHGGGQPLDPDGEGAGLIAAWIAQGAKRNSPNSLERLLVDPESIEVTAPQRIEAPRLTACFGDGTRRDVGPWAIYWSSDDDALTPQADGTFKLSRGGRFFIFVRYLSHVEAVCVTAPRSGELIDADNLDRHNWIDDQVNTTLAELGIRPLPVADDATFLRRVYLDLTGRLPPVEKVESFLDDRAADKRTALIDQLLASDEATDYWTYQFARWLRFDPPGGDVVAGETFYRWLREQVAADRGWQAITRELLLAQGDSHRVGPASFHRLTSDARAQAEHFSEVMLGIRLRCANCHNHPLDRWTQDDYHGLAQIFAPLERGRIVARDRRAAVIHPRTEQPAVVRIPGEPIEPGATPSIETLTDWLLEDNNPYFAQTIVGRIWHALMGRGIIEPVDDTRKTNPPSDERLLARLCEELIAHNYRLRPLIRQISLSAAYQRSSSVTDPDPLAMRFFASAHRRPLPPEVMADAVADVTGVALPGADRARTISLVALRPETIEVLRVFGRCDVPGNCGAEGSDAARSAAVHLALLNGPILNRRITVDQGVLRELGSQRATDDEFITTLYLRALSRRPYADERAAWRRELAAAADESERHERLEDLLWSLLNCQEFVTNH